MILTRLFPVAGLLTLSLPLIRAQTEPFIPFDTFLQGVQDATYAQWNGTAVESSAAFDTIKAHILSMYNGIGNISNTFILDAEYADCVDIDKQPTVRLLGVDNIQRPPSNSSHPDFSQGDGHDNYADSPLKLGLTDRFGNRVYCPDRTIPLARLTLQKLTRFPNLQAFFAKSQDSSTLPSPQSLGTVESTKASEGGLVKTIPLARLILQELTWFPNLQAFFAKSLDGSALPSPPSRGVRRRRQEELTRRVEKPHLHAIGYQYVKNFGGNSWLNVWNPVGYFTLSQQWYVGGSGDNMQTVEGGWIVYEQKFNTRNAVLFIYYTADDYGKQKCWNHDCAAFIQTNNNWFLGGTWPHYSVSGGTQWGFEMQWKLYNGNWWLFLKGSGSYEAVGYYPTKIFNGGQLSKNAELVQYGGEVGRLDPSHNWPQMGSGALPSAGWTKAAYQRSIFYIPKDENGGFGDWTGLSTTVEGLTKCWDIAYTKGGSWGSYFHFGGPGGKVCN